ncbi:putative retrotransposon hot spot (RHS) protein [Trypanosoma cruzi]|uniref:Putative retrotransposon hot spot (RHS) protein n=1 Tax=Trypanosoma cruzi TaxID=5693 RepID=A0A2V2V4R2_TRYCR|nr:putative retrotransposon hot spot (RHS) protein [Trypanosoma cruzi]RNC39075.1 putative retrotransposon hot spot (RHS) protein [Trypanosoma cruzi]
MWRCRCRLHVVLPRGRWASTASPTGVAVRPHGAPNVPPCERHAQRHWDCGTKQPRVSFGASGTCWPQLGGASGTLHRTGVVMAPRRGIPDDGSDAAARRVVEGTRQPQWTMSSSVEDILLEGRTNNTDMKLNDFIRSHLGGRAAVGEDYNVTMEAFVRRPNAYVQDQQLLEEILNLTEYRELKMELEKRKIPLEAIYKLHHDGVLSLEQWREFKRKDTITPLARRNLNRVLMQLLREESREVKERVRREEEEMLRRAQEMKFTISTTIEDVLFKGRVRVKEKRLNDFLTMELDGRGVAATNRNVLLKEFFKDPKKYIHDKGVLKEIKATDAYARMEGTVRDEMDVEEVVRRLHENGVDNLLGWSLATAKVKTNVHNSTKQFLNAALEDVRNPTTTSAPIYLEGWYESVYNARWHHVVEIPDGDKRKKTGTGMEVKEGEPQQSWTYKAADGAIEENDTVRQSGEAPPRLMVLTSDKGWPSSWYMIQDSSKDFFVNCEVDRVWQIVKDDVNKLFSSHGKNKLSPRRRVLIGTPGIGESMAAGSYLLYQLLHCDVEELQVVVHCFGETAYVFDKTTKTVSEYRSNTTSKNVLRGLWKSGMKVFIIYCVTEKGTQPDTGFAPPTGWGMIVVSSPKISKYDKWETQLKVTRIIVNCPDEMDVKAMCAWMKYDETPDKQAEYWKKVEEHMYLLGPIPRHIFDADEYGRRTKDVMRALRWINIGDRGKYFTQGERKNGIPRIRPTNF